MRAIPATATVPFFLVWFGFSESGRLLMFCLGTTLNIAVATVESVSNVPERFAVLFRSVGSSHSHFVFSYLLPTAVERMLPTLRVTLAACFALEIVSELLGAQIGLGYVLQSARTTFAMPTIFLVAIVLGIMNTLLDNSLRLGWQRLIFWR
jgi:ABC-type nitrate/sulfonate/bicarbonate transport system permease component